MGIVNILLSGKVENIAKVDEEDYPLVSNYIWNVHKDKYSKYARSSKVTGRIMMHSLILPKREGFTPDHRDGNGLNNVRTNLRYATPTEQARNRTGFLNKGTTFNRAIGKWAAQIMVKGINIHLGYFMTQSQAAEAYNKAAIKYFNEYAALNKVKT